MAVVKAEKGHAKEARKAKKLAKLLTTSKLGCTKKLPKTPKGKREETFGPLNLGNGEGWALIEKKSSKPPRMPSKWWNKSNLLLIF